MNNNKSLVTGISFDQKTCRFKAESVQSVVKTINEIKHPLSVILQITRKCDFDCIFCSETALIPDPTFEELQQMRDNLQGVSRIYISGGEPMLREDLLDILDLFCKEFIVGLPTNATVHSKITPALGERITFANIGLDGPRNITCRIRGDYDKIMIGIEKFRHENIPISLSCVVLTSTIDAVPFVCQIADVVSANKLKLILPITKGNALDLPDSEYLTSDQAEQLFIKVKQLTKLYGWKIKVTMTTWTSEVEGYSILVYPDGETYAWPVYNQPDKVFPIGNLIREPIETIWERNPYKINHIRKYLGDSIMVS